MEMVLISCPKTKIDIVELKTKEVNLNIIEEKTWIKILYPNINLSQLYQ